MRGGGLFDGLTWKGVALIALLCLLNALRRKIQRSPLDVTAFDWLISTASIFGLGLIAALPIALAVVATYNRVSPSPWRRYPALALAVTFSSLGSVALMVAIEVHFQWTAIFALKDFLQIWFRYAILAALATAVYVYARAAEESSAQARAARLDRERFDQQMEEARLQVLQAQIEPHFLFNTLATVRRLYHTTPESAVAMLDNLMRYLSVALPQMRATSSTLGRETALVEAYLGIQKLRMQRRLGFKIDVPLALRDKPMPPMMLLTLVENAIKHGINPLPEGSFLRIGASAEEGKLKVQVADSGQGFVQTSGAGTGLANTRARLAALYGGAAHLELGHNQPRGVTATITLPLTAPASLVAAS